MARSLHALPHLILTTPLNHPAFLDEKAQDLVRLIPCPEDCSKEVQSLGPYDLKAQAVNQTQVKPYSDLLQCSMCPFLLLLSTINSSCAPSQHLTQLREECFYRGFSECALHRKAALWARERAFLGSWWNVALCQPGCGDFPNQQLGGR